MLAVYDRLIASTVEQAWRDSADRQRERLHHVDIKGSAGARWSGDDGADALGNRIDLGPTQHVVSWRIGWIARQVSQGH